MSSILGNGRAIALERRATAKALNATPVHRKLKRSKPSQPVAPGPREIKIAPPNIQTVEFSIVGTTPYVQGSFSSKMQAKMRAGMAAGSTANKGRKREPRKFEDEFEGALHRSSAGWTGIPANAFRQAAISACRLAGFKMTIAKLSLFVEHDGYDRDGVTGLVRITKGEPEHFEALGRNADGSPDIRVRAKWAPGWRAALRIRYDADQFTLSDVANLVHRIGEQVGIGCGRPDSRESGGVGWGLFRISQ